MPKSLLLPLIKSYDQILSDFFLSPQADPPAPKYRPRLVLAQRRCLWPTRRRALAIRVCARWRVSTACTSTRTCSQHWCQASTSSRAASASAATEWCVANASRLMLSHPCVMFHKFTCVLACRWVLWIAIASSLQFWLQTSHLCVCVCGCMHDICCILHDIASEWQSATCTIGSLSPHKKNMCYLHHWCSVATQETHVLQQP